MAPSVSSLAKFLVSFVRIACNPFEPSVCLEVFHTQLDLSVSSIFRQDPLNIYCLEMAINLQ